MKEIGIMGGAFSPIHFAHLLTAQRGQEQFDLESVLFIPSGEPPHKREDLLDKDFRFEMVEAGVRGNPRFQASRIEIDRPGTTWSIDTLYQLREQYGNGYRLNFIIGDDNLRSVAGYNRREEFLSLCRLLVCPRKAKFNRNRIRYWKGRLGLNDLHVIDCPLIPISSTLIREWVKMGRSIRYLVPDPVAEIIEARGHYLVG